MHDTTASRNQKRRTRVSPAHLQTHPRQLQDYPRAPAFALTLGEDSAAVFTGDCPHNEKAKASSLHMTLRTIGNAVKAFEDALQLFRRDPNTLVADA